ncbi:MAG: hypothetical protein IPK79_07330 [Vampirovibrionales bacterium]|nr:hypothetical protein [Vampirovibrionales bacterium]
MGLLSGLFPSPKEAFLTPKKAKSFAREAFITPKEATTLAKQSFVTPKEAFVRPKDAFMNPKELNALFDSLLFGGGANA